MGQEQVPMAYYEDLYKLDFGGSMADTFFQPGETYPEHNHNFYEIFLVREGKVRHRFNGREEILHYGDMRFIMPNDVHGYDNRDGDAPCTVLNIAFESALCYQVLDNISREFDVSDYTLSRLVRLPGPQAQQIIDSLQRVQNDNFDCINGFKMSLYKVLLSELFLILLSDNFSENRQDVPRWLVQLQESILADDNFIYGIPRLVELSGKSQEHLTRTMKKYYGYTPSELINRLRLHKAANLLINTRQSVLEICGSLGFENVSYFNRLFKELNGVTPTQYRRSAATSLALRKEE